MLSHLLHLPHEERAYKIGKRGKISLFCNRCDSDTLFASQGEKRGVMGVSESCLKRPQSGSTTTITTTNDPGGVDIDSLEGRYDSVIRSLEGRGGEDRGGINSSSNSSSRRFRYSATFWEAAKQFLRENWEFANWQFYEYLQKLGASFYTAKSYLSDLKRMGLVEPRMRRDKYTIIYRSLIYEGDGD